MSVHDLMAQALADALMLRPVIWHINRAETPEQIEAIVNDAIDRGWLLPLQLPLLKEWIQAA